MYNHYQNIQISTAPPERILIMLYEGAVRFSKMALDRMENDDLAGKGKYIGKTLAIIGELRCTLNHEVGGDISRNLDRLYLYLIDEYTKANISNSASALKNAINVLGILHGAWVEAVEIVKKRQSENTLRAAG